MTKKPKEPIAPKSKKQAEVWYQVWFRHAVFGEGPLEITRHFESVGNKLKPRDIDDALRWGCESGLAVIADRRALRARTAASIAARTKLVWSEINRLQNAQKQGGLKEMTHTYDAKGRLKSTRVTHRDVSRDLIGAARALADLDRFGAAVDGLLSPEPAGEGIGAITMELTGFFEGAYTDPSDAHVVPPELPKKRRALVSKAGVPTEVESPAPDV